MARITSVVIAIGISTWRELKTIGSFTGQNLFVFLIGVALQPESAELFILLLGLIILFPLAADPMERVPEDRWRSWPLQPWERVFIRLVSLMLTPAAWLAIFLAVRAGLEAGAAFVALAFTSRFLLWLVRRWIKHFPQGNVLRWIPKLPGVLGSIAHLHLRALARTLDLYSALLLSVLTAIYRVTRSTPDQSVFQIMSLVVALALSTTTQVPFGLDGAGAERYRLMPVRGWQILFAKDLALLAVTWVLTAGLKPGSALAGMSAALVIGHHPAILQPIKQTPWRFTSGSLLPYGLLQTIALFSTGMAAASYGISVTAGCLSVWLASVYVYGQIWDACKN